MHVPRLYACAVSGWPASPQALIKLDTDLADPLRVSRSLGARAEANANPGCSLRSRQHRIRNVTIADQSICHAASRSWPAISAGLFRNS